MSRTVIVTIIVVLAALSIATPVLVGAPVEGVILYSVVLFVATGIVPIIIWAFGRFRARNAIVPMVVWGGLLFLSCGGVLAAANIGPLLDKLMTNPEMKKGYVDALKQSCIDRKGNSRSAASVAAQCDCEANRMAEQLRFSEMVDALKGNQSRELEQKIRDIVARCQSAAQR